MLAPQPFFEPRGTPFSVLGRLKALSHLGHQVDLVTYHVGQDVPIAGVTIHRTPRIPFIKSVKVGPSLAKVFLDVLVLARAVGLLLRRRYDLLHTHEEASFFGVLLARLFRVRHVYDMHSSPPQQLSNFQYTRFRPLVWLFQWLERRVIASSDAVITICPALEEHVKQVCQNARQVMIENVASEADPWAASEADGRRPRDSYPQVDSRLVVLYAGTFEPYQGLDMLLAAAAPVARQARDVLFVLVGGKPEQVQHYQSMARSLGVADHVLFTGTRPPEEVPAFIRLAHVLVSPRASGTNTPLKVYSYLRSGKPIVAADLPTHTQVLTPQVAVLVKPDPGSLAQGILSVLQDPALARRLGESARLLFQQKYSFESFVRKTEQVLQMAMG